MTEIIVAVVGLLAVPLGALGAWLVNRRKNIADINETITQRSVGAAGAAVEAMQIAMDTLSESLERATEQIEELQKEIVQLRHQNLLLLQENHALHAKIDSLVKIVNTGELPTVVPPLPEHPASDPAS